LKLSFDFAQDGEPVEPFRISNFVLRILRFNSSKRIIESHFIFMSFFYDVILSRNQVIDHHSVIVGDAEESDPHTPMYDSVVWGTGI